MPTSYVLETPNSLWRGYKTLVSTDQRIGDRIVVLMALDVVAHEDEVSDPAIEAAEAVLSDADPTLEVRETGSDATGEVQYGPEP